ncbi:ABC transporter permease [Nocardioides sp. Root151]|uniref:ABC transporter permease n=1 Tax=Nocardioides sp. Root151 TaxID=1736475 RepID=UPI0007025408|nr:ABC transporter permease [Nocardioides sp. Root151]KQZ67298.1 hypothetical protein ASD66_20245 [Nocardioides sp. Root151]
MIGLAMRSLSARRTAFTATFASIFFGTVLIGSFATLLETSFTDMAKVDQDTLFIMGAVVGSWGTIIVLFSLASTLGIAVRQRDVEIALLRTIGASPRQARRMIRIETFVVALVASALGAGAAWLGGRALFTMIREGGMVADTVDYAGGPASLGITMLAVLATSLVSATIAGRKATSGAATIALTDGNAGTQRMRWWRVLVAVLLIGYGVTMAVITITVTAHSDDPYDAMATSGSSSILVAAGLACIAPLLLRWAATLIRPLVGRAGSTGHLAAYNTSRRAPLLAGVLAPVIVFTSASIGTLMAVGIDGRTLAESNPDSDTINMLNNVVVGMISLFAAIMVVNAFAAVVSHRRGELARLRLLGATPEQVRGSVVAEAAIVAVVGVVLGTAASLATVVPFAIARDEGIVPDGQLWLPPVLAVVAVAITLCSAAVAVRRTTARQALAVAGAGQ